jgi:hypothetical protein
MDARFGKRFWVFGSWDGPVTLTVADIERWRADAVREVFRAAGARGQSTLEASRQLSSLAVFDTWEGATAESRKRANASIRQDLDAHGAESLVVARAAGKAADDIERVQSELRTLLVDVTELHMTVDRHGNKVIPTSIANRSPTEAFIAATQLQPRLDKILSKANAVDAELAAAINMAEGNAPIKPDTPGHEAGGQPGNESDGGSARTRNQEQAFKEVYGRDPVSANDWRMAAALDPHSYDPRNQGVAAQVRVVKIRPVPGQGLVRVSQWIPQRDVISGPGKRDFGNDRGPDPHFEPSNTKATTYIDYDHGVVVMRQNPSIEQTANGGPGRVKVGAPQANVTQTADGALRIRYDAANPFAPEIAKNPPFPITDHPWTVNGDLVFTPGASGVHVDGTRGDYPSMEVYQDLPNNTTNTILIDPARTGNSYGPIENLPFHHDIGIGGRVFEPFDRGGWNPHFDVPIPLQSTNLGSPSNPPSIPPLHPTMGVPS